jgi:sucrose synthase
MEFEAIDGTKYSNILRVPFRVENRVLRQWVSRFDVYPYIENFTQAYFEPSDDSF